VNREKRDVLAPIVATILDLIIARNVIRDRHDPLCLFVDELPTLYLPRLPNWLNENREDGLVTTIAFQALTQLVGLKQKSSPNVA
jgi:type IV secretory pathway TraG/TraD family ATPase VirD4